MQSRQPPTRLPSQESEISRFANPVSDQPLHFAPLCCNPDSVSQSSSVEQPCTTSTHIGNPGEFIIRELAQMAIDLSQGRPYTAHYSLSVYFRRAALGVRALKHCTHGGSVLLRVVVPDRGQPISVLANCRLMTRPVGIRWVAQRTRLL